MKSLITQMTANTKFFIVSGHAIAFLMFLPVSIIFAQTTTTTTIPSCFVNLSAAIENPVPALSPGSTSLIQVVLHGTFGQGYNVGYSISISDGGVGGTINPSNFNGGGFFGAGFFTFDHTFSYTPPINSPSSITFSLSGSMVVDKGSPLCHSVIAISFAQTFPVLTVTIPAGASLCSPDYNSDCAYSPNPLTISSGDSVVWTNADGSFLHTATSDDHSDTFTLDQPVAPQNSFSTPVISGGSPPIGPFINLTGIDQTKLYHCSVHPAFMKGTLIIHSGPVPTTTTTTLATTTTTMPNYGPSAVNLTPVNISTAPDVAQSFAATYSDPNGYTNIATASLGFWTTSFGMVMEYDRSTNQFTMAGAPGSCGPGQAVQLSDGYLTLNCAASSVSGSGTTLTITFNLTPQTPPSGAPYQSVISVVDQLNASNSKTVGYWIINRPPSVGATSPMNSTTSTGTLQTFTILYSDPDGFQNIAAANFYMSGNGGITNQWLHYLVAPNLFTIMGTNEVCNPGQAKTLSNSSLIFYCAPSTISGSGTNLTIVFQVTPLSGGINYNFFNGTSDQASAAFGAFGGTWHIQ